MIGRYSEESNYSNKDSTKNDYSPFDELEYSDQYLATLRYRGLNEVQSASYHRKRIIEPSYHRNYIGAKVYWRDCV